MAIVNRDLDPSQQTATLTGTVSVAVTGATYVMAIVPYQSQLTAAQVNAIGLSGAPNLSLWVQRFVAGAGVTSVVIGQSLVAQNFSVSGGQSFAIVGAGLSFLLQAGDCLMLATAAANTAALHVQCTMVVKALQDIKTSFGV